MPDKEARAAWQGIQFKDLQATPAGEIGFDMLIPLSSPVSKNILLLVRPKSHPYPSLSRPTEGRIAIVTNAGWDAVDAAALGARRDGRVGR